eukprot:82316_1
MDITGIIIVPRNVDAPTRESFTSPRIVLDLVGKDNTVGKLFQVVTNKGAFSKNAYKISKQEWNAQSNQIIITLKNRKKTTQLPSHGYLIRLKWDDEIDRIDQLLQEEKQQMERVETTDDGSFMFASFANKILYEWQCISLCKLKYFLFCSSIYLFIYR